MHDFRQQMGFDTQGPIHLNNAGAAPLCAPSRQVLQQYHDDVSVNGNFYSKTDWQQKYAEARSTCAAFFNCSVEELSFMPSCAAALSQAAFAFEQLEGQQILTFAEEYPSNVYPWLALAKEQNLKLIRVPSPDGNSLPEEVLLDAINGDTAVVAVSWVQYQSGATVDLARLARRCRNYGARLVVDAIQGIGILPFDWQSFEGDVLCLGTHKWLCGPLGQGLMISKKALLPQMKPLTHGALSYGDLGETAHLDREPHANGRRFEPGSPAVASVLATAKALEFLQGFGVANIYQAASGLATTLREALTHDGHQVYHPNRSKTFATSPIVTFRPRKSLEKAVESLRAQKISFAQRLDGIRLSPHAFNTEEEIHRAALALRDC